MFANSAIPHSYSNSAADYSVNRHRTRIWAPSRGNTFQPLYCISYNTPQTIQITRHIWAQDWLLEYKEINCSLILQAFANQIDWLHFLDYTVPEMMFFRNDPSSRTCDFLQWKDWKYELRYPALHASMFMQVRVDLDLIKLQRRVLVNWCRWLQALLRTSSVQSKSH